MRLWHRGMEYRVAPDVLQAGATATLFRHYLPRKNLTRLIPKSKIVSLPFGCKVIKREPRTIEDYENDLDMYYYRGQGIIEDTLEVVVILEACVNIARTGETISKTRYEVIGYEEFESTTKGQRNYYVLKADIELVSGKSFKEMSRSDRFNFSKYISCSSHLTGDIIY